MLRLEAIASGQAYLRLECRSWLADIATEGPEALEVFLAALKDILRGVNYRKRCSQRSPDFIFEPPGKVYGLYVAPQESFDVVGRRFHVFRT
jgi:hypothetical protein